MEMMEKITVLLFVQNRKTQFLMLISYVLLNTQTYFLKTQQNTRKKSVLGGGKTLLFERKLSFIKSGNSIFKKNQKHKQEITVKLLRHFSLSTSSQSD